MWPSLASISCISLLLAPIPIRADTTVPSQRVFSPRQSPQSFLDFHPLRKDPPLTLLLVRASNADAWAEARSRARSLVQQMTLEEKVNITGGFTADNVCGGNSGSVPRLNWPGMCLHDAGNGVRATDFVNAYPAGIHAGASWDRNLTYLRGLHMGREFKAKGGECFLARAGSCCHSLADVKY